MIYYVFYLELSLQSIFLQWLLLQTRRAKLSVLKLCKSSRLAGVCPRVNDCSLFSHIVIFKIRTQTHICQTSFLFSDLSGITSQNAYLLPPKVSLGGKTLICLHYNINIFSTTFYRPDNSKTNLKRVMLIKKTQLCKYSVRNTELVSVFFFWIYPCLPVLTDVSNRLQISS